MQGVSKKICAAFAACFLAVGAGMVGCGSTQSSSGDNSILVQTSAEKSGEQSFEEVTFGTYEQDGDASNGAEDITWYVLDEQDGKKLLISKYVLDAQPFDDTAKDVKWSVSSPRPYFDLEWADSTLRAWLNGEFKETAFGDTDSAIAKTTNNDTKNNAVHSAETAADPSVHEAKETQDDVFLLSVSEAKSYFQNNAARVTQPTDYALSKGAYVGTSSAPSDAESRDGDGNAIWWLRTNGYYAGYNAVVVDDGYVHGDGYRASGELHDGFDDHGAVESKFGGCVGVRPCVWVDASALA